MALTLFIGDIQGLPSSATDTAVVGTPPESKALSDMLKTV